ncbi:MAG: glycosyltransferase family 9 protein [Bacillota bacterium]
MPKFDKVLLISRWKTLGDSAVATVIAKELKRLNPACIVHAYVPYSVAAIWQMSPYIDKVYIHSKEKGLKKFFLECGQFMQFWRMRYDLAVAVAKSPTVVMSFLSMAKRKTGNTMSRMGKNFFSESIEKYDIDDRTTNIIRHYLYSLARLGLDVDFSASATLCVPDGVFEHLKQRLKLLDRYAVVCLAGSTYNESGDRNLSFNEINSIVRMLKNKYSAVYAIGSMAQREFIDKSCELCAKEIENVAGKLTITEMAALLKHCEKFVTIDTGPMHIADALGTPTIALFGCDADHFKRCVPKGLNTTALIALEPASVGMGRVDLKRISELI